MTHPPPSAAALLGLGAGTGVTSALWLVLIGYRVDAEGSTMTSFEQVAGWGGLVLAVVLLAIGAPALARSTGRSPRP